MNTSLSCFSFSDKTLDLSEVQVMGVLNVTPDSFSDGGKFVSFEAACCQAEQMLTEGASIIDVGGESTRPGAAAVSLQQELDRVCPVVERLVKRFDAIVSVDTSTPEVMTEVIRLGAGMINDIRAFSRKGAVDAIKDSAVALCIMHMQGEPEFMQERPDYHSVVDEVSAFLHDRAETLANAGIDKQRLILDPGFGFGKTLQHNMQLLNSIDRLCAMGHPVLIGVSRKSMFGEILGKPVDDRLYGSLAAATIAARQGATIIRAHDVGATRDAMLVVNTLSRLGQS